MREQIQRWSVFFLGLFFMGLGIAVTTNAQLGTTPISSVPLVVSFWFGASLGTCTFAVNVLFFLLQLPLLGRRLKPVHFFQVPAVLVFALFIDLGMWLSGTMFPQTWTGQALMCLLGCALLALGIMLEITSSTAVIPGEGLLLAISFHWKINLGNLKVLFDSTLVVLAIVLSLLVQGEVLGIREGTLIAALSTGFFVRFFARYGGPLLQRWFTGQK